MCDIVKKEDRQQGSAIFYILIGVILFAALGYAVANMMRGPSTKIGTEKARLYADEILDYAQALRRAVQVVMISNHCSDTEISFENSVVAGYTNGTNTACRIFHQDGGGTAWLIPVAEVNGAAGWVYTGHNTVPDVGTDSIADLVMVLPDVTQQICLALNDKIGIASVSGDAPPDTDDIDLTKFAGSYTASEQIGQTANFEGRSAGCFKNTTPDPDVYYFYQVLIAR